MDLAIASRATVHPIFRRIVAERTTRGSMMHLQAICDSTILASPDVAFRRHLDLTRTTEFCVESKPWS